MPHDTAGSNDGAVTGSAGFVVSGADGADACADGAVRAAGGLASSGNRSAYNGMKGTSGLAIEAGTPSDCSCVHALVWPASQAAVLSAAFGYFKE